MIKSRIVLSLISLLILLAIPIHAAAQDGTRCSNDESISYLWQIQDEDCVFEQAISFNINIVYPTEIANYDFARMAVEEYFSEKRSEFWQFANEMDFTFGFLNPWSLDIGYEVFRHSDSIMSLQFSESVYTGGAHPNLLFKTFTLNLETQQVLGIEDIFQPESSPLTILYPLVQSDLEAQMQEMFGGDVEIASDWIADGTGEDPYNYRNFVLTEESLIFYFEPYQVAAYAAGPFTVEIPLVNLQDILVNLNAASE